MQLSLCSGPVSEARGHGMAQILNQTCPDQQGHVAPAENRERTCYAAIPRTYPFLRRRIKTEEKAKIITGLIVRTAPGRYEEKDKLHQDDMENRMNSSLSSNHPGAK